jgi:hypothetical protein
MDNAGYMEGFRNGLTQWIDKRGGTAKIEHTSANKTTFITCS